MVLHLCSFFGLMKRDFSVRKIVIGREASLKGNSFINYELPLQCVATGDVGCVPEFIWGDSGAVLP